MSIQTETWMTQDSGTFIPLWLPISAFFRPSDWRYLTELHGAAGFLRGYAEMLSSRKQQALPGPHIPFHEDMAPGAIAAILKRGRGLNGIN